MDIHEANGNRGLPVMPTGEAEEFPREADVASQSRLTVEHTGDTDAEPKPTGFVTRADLNQKPGLDKRKLLLLSAGLLGAILFFVFTALIGRSPAKRKTMPAEVSRQEHSDQAKGSVTPLMDTVRKPVADNSNGQLSANDIKRTRSVDPSGTVSSGAAQNKPTAGSGGSLRSVPSFSDTQQRWEEPKPYGGSPEPTTTQLQPQGSLKEPSLVFVRSQPQTAAGSTGKEIHSDTEEPALEITPGTRIMAKLQTQISSAVSDQVIAEVEYTYAIGDRVVIPAGTRVVGQLRQVDRFGNVDVKFDELDLPGSEKEKIDATGRALDMGPIKGTVTGKNTGRNLLIRSASGIGSVAAMLVGNNTSSSFSEDDLLRERIAQNIGNAGDSELLSLNANSRIVVSVPADTKIYVVFTKHEQSPSTLHKVTSATP